MLEDIDFSKTLTIVEFGPGNGSLTKDLLTNLSSDSQLISFEINEKSSSSGCNASGLKALPGVNSLFLFRMHAWLEG
mgnify:CR=1 FL=1